MNVTLDLNNLCPTGLEGGWQIQHQYLNNLEEQNL